MPNQNQFELYIGECIHNTNFIYGFYNYHAISIGLLNTCTHILVSSFPDTEQTLFLNNLTVI